MLLEFLDEFPAFLVEKSMENVPGDSFANLPLIIREMGAPNKIEEGNSCEGGGAHKKIHR